MSVDITVTDGMGIYIPDKVHHMACSAAIKAGIIMTDYEVYFQNLYQKYGQDAFQSEMGRFAKLKKEPSGRESWLTLADIESHLCLIRMLHAILPNVPIVSEENSPEENEKILSSNPRIYWMIDGLDGTETFKNLLEQIKSGRFNSRDHRKYSINISLIVDGLPEVGIVYFPSIRKMFFTDSKHAYSLEGAKLAHFVEKGSPEDDSAFPVKTPYGIYNASSPLKCGPVSNEYPRENRLLSYVYGMMIHPETQKRIHHLLSPENLDYYKLPMTESWNDCEEYEEPRVMWYKDAFHRGVGQHRSMEVLGERRQDVCFNGNLMPWDYAATAAFARKVRGIIMHYDTFEDILLQGNPKRRYPVIPDLDWGKLEKLPPTAVLFPWTMEKLIVSSASKKGNWNEQDLDRFKNLIRR